MTKTFACLALSISASGFAWADPQVLELPVSTISATL